MHDLLRNGYKAKKRPSGHDISEKFSINNGAAIPPNLIAVANTESNGYYQRYCKEQGLEPHPARYPAELPEYFIRMLTDPGDLVIDPFAGSCVTGEVAERLRRLWVCIDLVDDYLRGGLGRFKDPVKEDEAPARASNAPKLYDDQSNYFRTWRPGLLWNGKNQEPLPEDGGRKRRVSWHA